MKKSWLLFAIGACFGRAFCQSPPPCSTTQILSVENLAAGNASNSLGGIAKISWCDFELPAPTTPVTSVLVHGRPAFVTLQSSLQTSPVTSVIYHGYPSYVPQQIVAQLPNIGVPVTSTQLQLMRGNTTIASSPIQVDEFAPGIFTLDGTPGGPAIIFDANLHYILPSRPARPGEVLTIFCEGLGPTNPFVPAGSLPSGLAVTITPPQVFVGGQFAAVTSSKLASTSAVPSAIGVYEVTFVVPQVSPGNQPVYISIGGKTSNMALLPVAP